MRECPRPAVVNAMQPRPMRECPRRVEVGTWLSGVVVPAVSGQEWRQWPLVPGSVGRGEQVWPHWLEEERSQERQWLLPAVWAGPGSWSRRFG